MARSVRLTGAEVQALAPHVIVLRQTGRSYPGTALRRATDKIEQANGAPTKARPKRKPPEGEPPYVSLRKWASKRSSAVEKRERRSETRDRCVVRSEGKCENPDCGRPATEHYPAHWDHFFGRARAESVETTWMLCPDCDHLKTHNDPDAPTWYRRFLRHLADQPPTRAYKAAAKRAAERLAFVETRSSLPASPRVRP